MPMRYDAGAAAYDELTGRWSRAYAKAALAAANVRPGSRLLDLATGTADTALIASDGDSGIVVAVDLSVPMLQVASAKCRSSKVVLVAADAKYLPFADGEFDCATCLFGLMFFPAPVECLRELRRVLCRGGRASFTTWASPDRAPFAGFMAEALAQELPDKETEILKPFCMSNPVVAGSYMQHAGFLDIRATTLSQSGVFASSDEYFRPYERGGGRLGQFYLGLGKEAQERVKVQVCRRLAPLTRSGSVGIQIEAHMVVGHA
jgi:ubiquinone/menaquinone biosynthesis C-methylase UbiE